MKKPKIIPIILCGGKGSRLWPLSRQSYPKQFLSLYGEDKKSLLQKTQTRISGISKITSPIIICSEEHRFLVAEQMRIIGVNPKAIILEPEGRNTAPAITIGALEADEEDEESILLILSADHKIDNNKEFIRVINKGYEYANQDRLVTFGVIPTYPETGYGYIESESTLNIEDLEGSKIKKFIEKPNQNLAEKFLRDGNFTWNSGIFMFKTKIFLEELKTYSPKTYYCSKGAMETKIKDLDFIRINENKFKDSPNISVDVAVMENTNLGTVLPLDAGWSDVGSWKSLWESQEKDKLGNYISGKVIDKDSKNCYIRSESRLIVTLGLNNLTIIETSDAILICDKNKTESIKSIVDQLQKSGLEEGSVHKKIFRPWGNYNSIAQGENWQVKKLEVKAGASLSLQLHKKRSEHWIVVKGTADVQIEDKNFLLKENQSTFIPIGKKHRLSNPFKEPLEVIEVQSGYYLGEDDIVRFDDNYGRF